MSLGQTGVSREEGGDQILRGRHHQAEALALTSSRAVTDADSIIITRGHYCYCEEREMQYLD